MTAPPPIYYFLQIAVPASLIVAGWFVVYANSKKIESRKEARDFVEQIEGLIDTINIRSKEYYNSNENTPSENLSSEIKASFTLLSHYLFILKGLGIRFKNTTRLVMFKKLITGSYFETKDFKNQLAIPGWNQEVSNATAELKLSVRQAYFEWCGSYKAPTLPASPSTMNR